MRRGIHQHIRNWSLIALLATLPFSLFLNAFFIGVLALNRLLDSGDGNTFSASLLQPFVWISSLLALFLLVRCCFSENVLAALKITERKSALLLLPLALFTSGAPEKKTLQMAARIFAWSLCAAALYCLIMAGMAFSAGGQKEVFFYHALGEPLHLHAVYFSFLILTALLMLQHLCAQRKENLFLSLFLFGILLLLGSKLFILLSLLYISWLFLVKNPAGIALPKRITLGISPFILLVALYLVPNPVGKRFRDISLQRLELARANYIGDDVYLDGLTLRVLQSRLALEIVSEDNNWLWGVGPDKAQNRLDDKYRELNLYAGNGKENTGIIGYNFHNQFTETLVQAGIVPLILLVSLFVWLLKEAFQRKNEGFFFCILAFGLFCLSESALERSLGVISFMTVGSLWLLYAVKPEPLTPLKSSTLPS